MAKSSKKKTSQVVTSTGVAKHGTWQFVLTGPLTYTMGRVTYQKGKAYTTQDYELVMKLPGVFKTKKMEG